MEWVKKDVAENKAGLRALSDKLDQLRYRLEDRMDNQEDHLREEIASCRK